MFKSGAEWNGNANGRPKKKTFREYWSDEEISEYVEYVKKNYKLRPEITKLVGEQLFGKPAQNINLGNEDGGPLIIKVIRADGNPDNQITPVARQGDIQPPEI
jgi:hypothetical protein